MYLPLEVTRTALDRLYAQYNRRELIHPDPLEFVHEYEYLSDREIVGIVASSLAYGRVAQIVASVSTVLMRMGPAPSRFLRESSSRSLQQTFKGFKHRFTTGEELAALLSGARRAIEHHGSLEACFMAQLKEDDSTILPALASFVDELNMGGRGLGNQGSMFLPSPMRGSACKRLNLFLRWMVRRDDVDPGGWEGVSPSMLIVPLDTHMHRIARMWGLTERKQADMRAALEITDAFRTVIPEDPVRYDFSLTRLGIRNSW